MNQFSLFEGPQADGPEERRDETPEAPPALAASEAAPAEDQRPRYRTEVKLDWYMGKMAAVVRTNLPGERAEQYEEFTSKEEALAVYGSCRREDDHEVIVWLCERKVE
jgi:hypothetical protein